MPVDFAKLSVLIVDGDKFARSLLKGVLEDLGFQGQHILQSGDGREALDFLTSSKVNVIICTRQLGSMDGVEFVKALRDAERSPAPGIPVIFCSRQLDKKLVGDVRDAGANEVVAKPISMSAIEKRLRKIVLNPRPLITVGRYLGSDRRRIETPDLRSERRLQNY